MARDRAIGAALVIGAIIGVLVYGTLMFAISDSVALLVLKITAFVAVFAILAILGWIGYVMATTPPPVPLEQEPSTTTSSPSGSDSTASGVTSEKKM